MITDTRQSIEIRRLIPAAAAEVFEAWIDPALLARWFAPGALEATVDRLEPREGGCLQITMHDPESDRTHTVGGSFVEIVAPERIRMTWLWHGVPEPASQVTVDFVPRSVGTEIVIRHDQLDREAAEQHRAGWNACLDKLERGVPPA